MFSGFKRQAAITEVTLRRSREATYTEPLSSQADVENIKLFLGEFYRSIYKRRDEIQTLLQKYPRTLGLYYQRLVPSQMTYEDFWQRYFFRCDEDRIMKEWEAQGKKSRQARAEAFADTMHSAQKLLAPIVQSITNISPAASHDEEDEAGKEDLVEQWIVKKKVGASCLTEATRSSDEKNEIKEPAPPGVKIRSGVTTGIIDMPEAVSSAVAQTEINEARLTSAKSSDISASSRSKSKEVNSDELTSNSTTKADIDEKSSQRETAELKETIGEAQTAIKEISEAVTQSANRSSVEHQTEAEDDSKLAPETSAVSTAMEIEQRPSVAKLPIAEESLVDLSHPALQPREQNFDTRIDKVGSCELGENTVGAKSGATGDSVREVEPNLPASPSEKQSEEASGIQCDTESAASSEVTSKENAASTNMEEEVMEAGVIGETVGTISESLDSITSSTQPSSDSACSELDLNSELAATAAPDDLRPESSIAQTLTAGAAAGAVESKLIDRESEAAKNTTQSGAVNKTASAREFPDKMAANEISPEMPAAAVVPATVAKKSVLSKWSDVPASLSPSLMPVIYEMPAASEIDLQRALSSVRASAPSDTASVTVNAESNSNVTALTTKLESNSEKVVVVTKNETSSVFASADTSQPGKSATDIGENKLPSNNIRLRSVLERQKNKMRAKEEQVATESYSTAKKEDAPVLRDWSSPKSKPQEMEAAVLRDWSSSSAEKIPIPIPPATPTAKKLGVWNDDEATPTSVGQLRTFWSQKIEANAIETRSIQGLEGTELNDNISTDMPSERGIITSIALFVAFAAVLVAISFRHEMLSANALCAPVMPETTLGDDDIVSDAPWWTPSAYKERVFQILCGSRPRIRFEWIKSGGTSHKLIVSTLTTTAAEMVSRVLEKRQLLSATIHSSHMSLVDRKKVSTDVDAPWAVLLPRTPTN